MPAFLTITLDPVAVTIALICAAGAGFMIRFLVALLVDEKQARANAVLPKRGPHLVKSVHPHRGNRGFDREDDLVLHGFGRGQSR
jgi:hypothetical protein